ncbi:Na(+)/H(+) antiporter subunit D [Haloarchaeobius sp. HRN-SO-5]|uniref:Na(+)/H(+) antiporter subunit D n=1 Tax=Haloarchaeobius sp. HRN-SO-5 TaxID=3446118 RepID=UPI003EB9265F
MVDPLTLLPPAVVLVLAAVLVAVLPRRAGTPFGIGLPVVVATWLAFVPEGVYLRTRLFGFDVALLHVDPFSRTVGLVLAFLAGAGIAYGYGTGSSRRQLSLSLLYLGAGLGAVFAGDWLTLVVAWEVLAVGATALVWVSGDASARRAGLRYAIYHELGGLALLAAVLVHFTEAGTFLFDGGGLAGGLAATLGLVGIGLNVGFVSLHPWLVDTYPRPHVATSVVLAACTTKVGVYALARAFPDGGVLLAYLGGVMLVVGVTYAILQTDVRRLLSYHIVSQVGFMVAGIGIASPLGVAGAFAHLVNNVLYKSLLFAVAGVLVVRTGESNLKRLGGLARPMPVTLAAFLVAALAISGVPGFNGFVSKAMVVDAAEDAGLDVLWWLLVVGSVGTVVSFAKFGYYAFFHGDHGHDVADAGRMETLAFAALAIPCVVFGLVPALQFAVLPGSTEAAKPFATSQFVKAGAILAAGGVAFVLLRDALGRVSGVPDLDSVYHPAGNRLLWAGTVAVGETASRLDSAVRRATAAAIRVASHPERLREEGPLGPVPDDSIGTGIALLVLALVVVLGLLFV